MGNHERPTVVGEEILPPALIPFVQLKITNTKLPMPLINVEEKSRLLPGDEGGELTVMTVQQPTQLKEKEKIKEIVKDGRMPVS